MASSRIHKASPEATQGHTHWICGIVPLCKLLAFLDNSMLWSVARDSDKMQTNLYQSQFQVFTIIHPRNPCTHTQLSQTDVTSVWTYVHR